MSEADPAEPLLEKLSPDVRALMQQARTLIGDVIPLASEKVHMGWGVIHYRAGETMRDVVVALAPHRGYVNLEFGDGVDLPDPVQRLEGTGKRLRHVKLRSEADVRDVEVRSLLQAQARVRKL